MKRWSPAGLFVIVLLGCNEEPLKTAPADAGTAPAGLTAEQATRTVAKVGDRTITLGDFAKAIERMDQFDRLRYQSKERRRELLEDMIDVQLLAAEARRTGLDKDPEAADSLRIILRDSLLAEARKDLPTPAQLAEQEVRGYFDAHPDKFNEPERRRVSAIVIADKKEAAKVLKEALKIKTPAEWGELFAKHSLTAPKTKGPTSPAELAGDLGIVGPLDDPRGAAPKVPESVRAAAFKLKEVNEIDTDLVESEGRQFIVRLSGVTPSHKRSLAEADRAIRVLLIQEKMAEHERALEDELRRKFPVQIDEGALAAVKVPAGFDKVESAAGSPRPAGAEADGGN
jgi:peptidyl-prolyl cis-trans isomerase C